MTLTPSPRFPVRQTCYKKKLPGVRRPLYGGIVDGYDKDKDGGYHYHVVFDDGDESDCTWREIQLGLIWGQTGGFVAGEHDDPLPTGPIGSAGSTE